MMRILLVRPGYESIFSHMDIVTVEPLELEILSTVAAQAGHQCRIWDGVVQEEPYVPVLQKFRPDLVAITGYITQKNSICRYAETAKKVIPGVKVIIGGVHAELNYRDFYGPAVDFIVHSGGIKPFQKLIGREDLSPQGIGGICFRQDDETWVFHEKIQMDPDEIPIPDRSFFYAHQDHFHYAGLGPCATVKTAYSCPGRCNFCYCCLLNGGKYVCRDLEKTVEEIAAIDCDYIWILDDIFYLDPGRIRGFARLIKERGIQKNFIVYYRADFIAENEELIVLLKNIGLKMVLVGLEAFDDDRLGEYHKQTSCAVNEKCLDILKKHGIGCTGLFILDIDATKKDFDILARYVKKHRLALATAAILTPLPGTAQYEKFKDRLITDDPRQWDFLHLVAAPGNMRKGRFYFEFYRFYVQVLRMNQGKWLLHLGRAFIKGLRQKLSFMGRGNAKVGPS
ncbi:B12-binding domain-containing radical SAM protein [Candidatus Formimonas warabiya]|uniref:Uncharacterized protein n=1 Tax=Formimonas warabiya TaxID=1761012 RepID=A0A3G1KRG0_FORW1|nr:cobalamin-dependent protein [Candidatus Formimonas warabiya]ATW25041.1 hypothetical protein DCMF_09860 [Candidatus Formimonas warabiya]